MSNTPRESLQSSGWTIPQIISTSTISETVYSWFPDLAVDEFSSVHAIWSSTRPLPNSGLQEQESYSRLTRSGWSKPNDIVPPSPDIFRNAIASDLNGHVLMLFRGSINNKPLTLYYTQANVEEAWSAQAWTHNYQINRGSAYLSDIAVDSHGVIHVIYDDTYHFSGQENQVVYADIYYRKSTDGGMTWSSPINLSNSPETGSARSYLEVDSSDTIHVTWDEGWDRLSGVEADSLYSAYTNSKDEGESWSAPKNISYPNDTPVQLSVGANGKGSVMLVWRSKLDQRIYYQWSSDNGVIWSVPPTIPNIFARPWSIPFDMYHMATDSNGNIHLILVGQLQKNNPIPGVYHLVWNGKWWSNPEKIFQQDNLYPEYPKIVISEGNQIHAVWFTREGSMWTQSNRQVWYSRSQADAPHVAFSPRPTPTTPSALFTQTPHPSPTPRPTISSIGIDTPSSTKETDYLKILAFALSPVVLLIGAVVTIKLWARSRGR
jgi:hypothetical protein